MVTGLHPWCPLPPHSNPPPRRGEGRVGVMYLMSFLQWLGPLRKVSRILTQRLEKRDHFRRKTKWMQFWDLSQARKLS